MKYKKYNKQHILYSLFYIRNGKNAYKWMDFLFMQTLLPGPRITIDFIVKVKR